MWSRCVGEDPGCFSERRGIAAFGDMLRSFPIDDPLNEEILETLNQVRGKFKTVVALLGMHHEYNDAVGNQQVTFWRLRSARTRAPFSTSSRCINSYPRCGVYAAGALLRGARRCASIVVGG